MPGRVDYGTDRSRGVYHNQATGDLHVTPTGRIVSEDSAGNPITATLKAIQETILKSAFTDGGGTSGTYQMAQSVPAGAILLGSKVVVNSAFSGDTSAVIIIGDGTDTDRYMTGTPSVFTAAANGIETGAPSGAKLVTTANRPTVTVTSATDFTNVAGTGSITVTIFYLDSAG